MNYYIDTLLGDESKGSPHKFDSKGVMMTKIPYTQDYHYHATAIASYALTNITDKNIFDTHIRWLMNNMENDGAYRHDFSLPFYNFEKNWVGGLAQGLSISALVRAYHKYNDKTYLESAFKAFNGLRKHCLHKDEGGNYWIKEFPGVSTILNGFIYALFGVYDVAKEGDQKAEKLWDQCISTLVKNLKNYDMNYWSKYDLQTGIPATLFYHKIHIEQTKALANLTNIEIFQIFSGKWQQRLDSKYFNFKVKFKRNVMILKKHGILGTYRTYRLRKNWLRGEEIA